MMKNFFALIVSMALLGLSCSDTSNTLQIGTDESDFNFGWQFRLVDSTAANGAWKSVRLPHDWSVEASFDSINGEGATGYLPGGMGQYRKSFPLALKDDQTAYLLFDGVYNNAEVSLNGQKLGFHPYGYSPFYFDISKPLKVERDTNVLEVKVDRTRYADSRWYTGSGIYRNVELLVKNKMHIPVWGVFVMTPKISKTEAEVLVEVRLKNDFLKDKKIDVVTELFAPDGKKVASTTEALSITGGQEEAILQRLSLKDPSLWDVDDPTLYNAVVSIVENGKSIDRQEIPFGIRNIKFDVEKGFFLNGRNMKIKGVCLHHDAGLVGAAVPKGVWKRRLEKLRGAGCNAIRIAHNPASQEFLDLCDAMGFLVQDEFFDEWDNPKDKRKNMNEQSVDYITRGYGEHFQEWAEKDLKNTVLAHRNHPSIIQWSIGNEIEWTYPRNADATGFFNNMDWSGNYFWSVPPNSPEKIREKLETLPKATYDIGKTAQKLADWTRELDTTRYIIANCILPSASYESGYTDALDMVGYSYRRVMYDYGRENYPDKPIMGTENLGQWHEWEAILERPFISGTFLWTGIDYMGESNGGWPTKGSGSGLLDMAGFEKPSYYMFKSLWNDGPGIYLATQTVAKSIYEINTDGNPVEKEPGAWKQALWGWHDVNEYWNYGTGETIIVEVYSNCDEVELFLNGASIGVKRLADFDDHIYKWAVPYKTGTLLAKGKKNGSSVETKLVTTAEPVSIRLSVDKKELDADGYDVAHIVAQLVDAEKNAVQWENRELTFKVDGDLKVLGVDNGAADNVQDFQAHTITTDKGRCLIIVQSEKGEKSEATLTAMGEGLESGSVSLIVK